MLALVQFPRAVEDFECRNSTASALAGFPGGRRLAEDLPPIIEQLEKAVDQIATLVKVLNKKDRELAAAYESYLESSGQAADLGILLSEHSKHADASGTQQSSRHRLNRKKRRPAGSTLWGPG